jgi:hypothetical protein
MSNDYLPMGTWDGDPSAPWNQAEPEQKEIEVTVSVTLSKTVTILVDDYTYTQDCDEDGPYEYYDYSDCNLHSAVNKQITLPQDAGKILREVDNANVSKASIKKEIIEDLENWNVDEMEVILE